MSGTANTSQGSESSRTTVPSYALFCEHSGRSHISALLLVASSMEESMRLQHAEASKSRVPEYLMYKNHLQEYAQSFGFQLPTYSSVNEGVNHIPKFRASVVIDGEKYESYETFLHQRDAEQDVARIALESISKRMKDEAHFFIHADKLFCKSILIEFAVKLKLKVPTYQTSCSAKGPDFVSSLIFDGKHYTGTPGKNKKEAEQMAARIAIQSFLAAGNSSSSILLARIIKSKIKLCPSHHMVNGSTTSNRNLDTNAPSPSGKRKAVEQVAQNQARKPKKDLLTNVENGSNGTKWQTDCRS